MKKSNYAFTMIEMVFVIVVLGILAAIAVPRLAATRVDAQITKGRSDISSIRSAIVSERQGRLIKGDSTWITQLHSSSTSYFDGNGTAGSSLLMYGITPEDKDGHWHGYAAGAGGTHTYKYKLEGTDNVLTYDPSDGTFKCTSGTNCSKLTK